MKELGIAKIIVDKRREKGVTQDELASYIGVSKASVSKWETGQSYPDITFLPQLAAYFNISIDYLIGYEPQMIKSDIQKLYHRLANDFMVKPFQEVYKECEQITHKYFSCFPLLYQMATLYLNHYSLCEDKEFQTNVLEEVIRLCQRIRLESNDTYLTKDAMSMEAVALISIQKPKEVFELLGDNLHTMQPEAELISQAYLMLGNRKKAIETMQVSSYQNMLFLVSASIQLISMNGDNPDKWKEILKRTIGIVDLYKMDQIHPNSSIGVYITGAQAACSIMEYELAIEMLKRYEKVACESNISTLHGDDYYDQIDAWIGEVTLQKETPRNAAFIKAGLISIVEQNPAFTCLKDNKEYQQIVTKLKKVLGGE